MSERRSNITALKVILSEAEQKVETVTMDLDTAAAEMARVVGPLATAHRLAQASLELYEVARKEGLLP